MKVAVDPDRCQGHARCWEICPEVFSLDEVGHSVAASGEVPSALEAEVTKAAANCPERAITVSLALAPAAPAPEPSLSCSHPLAQPRPLPAR